MIRFSGTFERRAVRRKQNVAKEKWEQGQKKAVCSEQRERQRETFRQLDRSRVRGADAGQTERNEEN